ncbi:deoxyribose-phosphate aldolase [Synechococcus sp. J7-Johnson]|uniref:deoxyribose-phosphate aldolase n=1 Tax=Synechococcus sp. J7-Johnson TaxID=2823737 RepID=UPI0020CED89D|nr:deoxyribose-phosphate aldolase [Synechococcus sp. J7-Johnson]MCP9839398.1 deoxyribose-phosphate aldolase [Synechococcus sp. J7-Johnson]
MRDSRFRGPLPDLAPLIEHALLDPHRGLEHVHQACDQARHYGFAAVCVSSRWVAAARERLGGSGSVKLVAVVAFPFGAVPALIKLAEAEAAASAGADELDVVPDFGALADGNGSLIYEELGTIVELGLPVKVIQDVARLDSAALELLVEASIDAGAAYLKTGSGFGSPVTPEQVAHLRELARGRAGIQASGGIAELEQAFDLVAAGATRLGTSRGVALIEAMRAPA